MKPIFQIISLILLVLSLQGQPSSKDTIIVSFEPKFVCAGECTTLKPVIEQLKKPATYQWATGEISDTLEVCPSQNESYSVTITDADGNTAAINHRVAVIETGRMPNPTALTKVCEGEEIKCIYPEYRLGRVIEWSGPNGYSSFGYEQQISNATASQAGRYSVAVFDRDGCAYDTAHIGIEVNDGEYVQSTPKSIYRCNTICQLTELNHLTYRLDTLYSYGLQPISLSSVGDIHPTNNKWMAFVAQEGDYTIEVSSTNCDDSDQGVIMGIYGDRWLSELITGTNQCSMDKLIIDPYQLKPGYIYYLFVDGFGGNTCDVSIEVKGNITSDYCTDYLPMETLDNWETVNTGFGDRVKLRGEYMGDTIINGNTYMKLVLRTGYPYTGLFREDVTKRKVYQYTNFKDNLLYDFSLEVGDKFFVPFKEDSITVFKIDTVLSHFGTLRRWNFSGSGNVSYTEAIGGEAIEWYFPLLGNDISYANLCHRSGCEDITFNYSCGTSPPPIEKDTMPIYLCDSLYHGYGIG